MTNETMPADWAIEKAADGTAWRIEEVKTAPHPVCAWILRLARYIEAHEEPPVDRKLFCAREAAARDNTTLGDEIRSGELDGHRYVGVAFEAVTLWEEGFGNDQH